MSAAQAGREKPSEARRNGLELGAARGGRGPNTGGGRGRGIVRGQGRPVGPGGAGEEQGPSALGRPGGRDTARGGGIRRRAPLFHVGHVTRCVHLLDTLLQTTTPRPIDLYRDETDDAARIRTQFTDRQKQGFQSTLPWTPVEIQRMERAPSVKPALPGKKSWHLRVLRTACSAHTAVHIHYAFSP